MKQLLCACIILLAGLQAPAQTRLMVKISLLDCALCDIQLFNVRHLQQLDDKVLVCREADRGTEDLAPIVEAGRESGMRIVYSDSAFYALDSSGRSKLYLLAGDQPIYHSYLKESNVLQLQDIINARRQPGHQQTKTSGLPVRVRRAEKTAILPATPGRQPAGSIIMPRDARVSNNQGHIYILANNRNSNFLYIIDKNRLDRIADTIDLQSDHIQEDIFRTRYPNSYKARYANYRDNVAQLPMPVSDYFTSTSFRADTMFVLASTHRVDTIGEDYNVSTNMSLLVFKGKDYITNIPINTRSIAINSNGDTGSYFITGFRFFSHERDFYFMLYKKHLSERNYVFAKTIFTGNTLQLTELMPVPLAQLNQQNGLGYNLLDSRHWAGKLAYTHEPLMYDLKTGASTPLELSWTPNNITRQQMNDLNYKMQSYILDMAPQNNKLTVIHKQGKQVLLSRLTPEGKKIEETILSDTFPNPKLSGYFTIDPEHIYYYAPEEKAFKRL